MHVLALCTDCIADRPVDETLAVHLAVGRDGILCGGDR